MSNMSSRVGRQAESLRNEAQETVSTVADSAREMAGDVASAVQRRAGELAEVAMSQGGKMAESAGEIGTGLRHALERQLERQPITTLLVAVGAALVVGSMLRR